jgi:hypothetical protein
MLLGLVKSSLNTLTYFSHPHLIYATIHLFCSGDLSCLYIPYSKLNPYYALMDVTASSVATTTSYLGHYEVIMRPPSWPLLTPYSQSGFINFFCFLAQI